MVRLRTIDGSSDSRAFRVSNFEFDKERGFIATERPDNVCLTLGSKNDIGHFLSNSWYWITSSYTGGGYVENRKDGACEVFLVSDYCCTFFCRDNWNVAGDWGCTCYTYAQYVGTPYLCTRVVDTVGKEPYNECVSYDESAYPDKDYGFLDGVRKFFERWDE